MRVIQLAAGGAVALALLPAAARAEEIDSFRVTGIEGHVNLRYVSDVASTAQTGSANTTERQSQAGLRSELFVMSHSYAYHPNFLTLDIGGGPILYGENVSSGSGRASARGALYNLSARASFLRDKPYRGNLFFEHLNPTVSISPGQVLNQESNRYGLDFSLLAPVTPIPLQGGFTRTHTTGSGSERTVDDLIDQFTLNASRSHGALGSTQLQLQTSQQTSTSGSLNLPIQTSTAANHALNLDTRLQFGDDRQYDLTGIVSLNSQQYTQDSNRYPDLQDQRLMLDARARHTAQLHSHGSYSYSHSTQGSVDAATQSANAGLSYWPMTGVEATLGVRGDDTRTRQYTTHAQGMDGAIRYEQALPLGVAQFSYDVRYDQRSQQALAGQSAIFGEQITLTGTAYTTLGHPHVVAGSPVVTNASRSQTFVAGIDYLLSIVGTETRIQRLIGGGILDGEKVLVDYSHDVGGTYAYQQLDQALSMSWNWSRYLNVFFRHVTSAPRLSSGSPTFPLNEVRSHTFGARADLPLDAGIALTLGGGFERENRQETISPYRRSSEDIYVQTEEPLFDLGYVRASRRHSRIEYGNAAQNTDLDGYELRFWSRHWFGIDLTATLGGEQDRSGLLPRRRSDASFGAQWQERKFHLTASLVRSRETQGEFARDRTTFQFLARREF